MPADPSLFDELLTFVMARATDRKASATERKEWEKQRAAEDEIELIVMLAGDVRQHPYAMAEGIEWLRARAVRDQAHPHYDPIWKPAAK